MPFSENSTDQSKPTVSRGVWNALNVVTSAVLVAAGLLLGARIGTRAADRIPKVGPEGYAPSLIAGEPERQAVVDAVSKGWAADRAGIRAGDVLLAWKRGRAGGPVATPLDLSDVEALQAPLGPVTLLGTRDGKKREWTLPPGRWCLWPRPSLPAGLLALFRAGQRRIASGDFDGGIESWRTAVKIAVSTNEPVRAAWLQARLGRELAAKGRWSEGEEHLRLATQRLGVRRREVAIQLLVEWLRRKDGLPGDLIDLADHLLQDELGRKQSGSLSLAATLFHLAEIRYLKFELASSQSLFKQAAQIQREAAPSSIDLLWSLEGEAAVALRGGSIDSASHVLDDAFAILRDRHSQETFEDWALHVDLGTLAVVRGEIEKAETIFTAALLTAGKLNADGYEVANTLSTLGAVELKRGELASAEVRIRRAEELLGRLAPEGPLSSQNCNLLGDLAGLSGDLSGAREQYRRAQVITERIARDSPPMSFYVIFNLYTLAAIEKRNGNLAKVDEYLGQIQSIQERTMRWSFELGGTYYQRGLNAFERGDLAPAERLLLQSLSLRRRLAPESIFVSDSSRVLGSISFRKGDSEKAKEYLERSLAIYEKLAPGTSREAETLNWLGKIDRRQRDLLLAVVHFCRASEAFDVQRRKLGGTPEGRSAFGSKTSETYRDCSAALVDVDRPEEAFHGLERGRARAFLELLAQRDVRGRTDVLPQLDRERRQANAEFDRTQAILERLSPARDQVEIDRLLVRLRELRAQQEKIAERIRRSSPRVAALQYPRPLDLVGARAILDPGTVLLAWSTGEERSFLFVVHPQGNDPGLEVFPIAIGSGDLRKRVESFRALLLRQGPRQAALADQARELYDLLLRPADAAISKASRLLISPDGPLHTLPFAALRRDGRWLAEQKPIHEVLSATVYADLLKARRRSRPIEPGDLVAFGDPKYPAAVSPGTTDPEVRSAVTRGLALNPLAASSDEVRGIAALFPGARTFLGADATEERAKAVPKETRYLHFSCHGLLDERFPLNSALALTIPEHPKEGEDNGLLQAWEIFEGMRLDADLVTLSSCDSALGQENGGEGLLGLTRAFQYAGARSVLGSLWSVSDRATAELMKRFYAYLRAGLSKDEALRRAQVDLIRSPHRELQHPYAWAAFQLSGDWR